MAIYHEDIVNINLESGNIHRSFAKHSIGSADNLANRFGVRVYRDGAEVDLSGCSCYGYFRNSNGDNIALTSAGTVDGNVAYVTLPQACYNYEGQFTLTIKLIGGGITGTMRIVDGMVDNTNTGSAVAPTETVPSYTEILETYDAMVAATAAANTAIAPAFAQGTANAAGALVINDGALYILPNGHTAGTTWANTTKIATNLGDELSATKSALYDKENNLITRVREILDLDANQVLTGTLRQIFGMCGRVVPSATGELIQNADWISCYDMFSAPNGTSIKINMNGYGAQYSIVEAKYNSDGTLNMRAFHSNASTLSFTIENGQTYRFGITKVGSRITDNEADICTVTVTEPSTAFNDFVSNTNNNINNMKGLIEANNVNNVNRVREAVNIDQNQVISGTMEQTLGFFVKKVPNESGVLINDSAWATNNTLFSAPNGTRIQFDMNGEGTNYTLLAAIYDSSGNFIERIFHDNQETYSYIVANNQKYRFAIHNKNGDTTVDSGNVVTVTVTDPENKLYQFYQETKENNVAVSQIASVPDNIRAINIFEGSQYDTNTPITGLTVKKKYYSGLTFDGSLAVGAACSVTKQHFDFDSSKTYSVYVQSKQNKRQITFGIRYVVDGETYTLKKSDGTDVAINLCNKAYSFVPYTSVENAYFSIFCTSLGADPCVFNDDEYYFYVVEGAYSTEDFEVSNFFASRYEQKQITENLSVGLPILRIYGDITEMTKENSVTLDYIYGSASGSCTMKWQGGSSLLYEKKNYTIKFDNKIDVGWGEQKKYCLKANYIDCTHSMNICAANLWAEIVEDRGTNPAIDVSANCGAVDGFPIIILLNDHFHGLYTMNIPKDPWCFGMGGSLTEYIVNAEIQGNPTYFKSAGALLDGTDFELEYKPDGVSDETVRTALNNMLSAVVSATGSGWETSVNPYMDVDAAIDYMIFSALVQNSDGFGKNYILTTYDGVKWWYNAYDLDAVFGNHWTGGHYYPINQERTSFAGQNDLIRLHHLIYSYSKDKLIARYKELRSGILSEAHVYDTFYNFAAVIPQAIRLEDQKAYPTIPATFTQTLERIMTNYRLRCEFMDAEVKSLET